MTVTEVGERMVAEARRRAIEAHPELADTPTAGPLAEMLLARGFTPDRVRAVTDNLLDRNIAVGHVLMAREDAARFAVESEVTCLRAEGR